MGTDNVRRDTLARLIGGLRVSLLVALFVEALNIGIGATLGLIAGYFGGWLDFIISRVADMLFAFPGLLLAILVSAVFGHAAEERFGGIGRLLLVAGALSLVGWPLMARYVRGQTLALRERDFVLAARSLGANDGRIIVCHILPNLAGLIVVSSTLDVANVVISEAVFSSTRTRHSAARSEPGNHDHAGHAVFDDQLDTGIFSERDADVNCAGRLVFGRWPARRIRSAKFTLKASP